MALKILSREDRLKTITGITMVIADVAGIAKTRLLTTIDKPSFCFDLENGLTSVMDWKGESSKIKTWNSLRNIACLIGGPDHAVGADQPYSQKHYENRPDKEKVWTRLEKKEVVFEFAVFLVALQKFSRRIQNS